MKSTIRFCSKVIIYTAIVLVCFEISLLLVGYRSYKNLDYKVSSTPSYPFNGDDSLGFCLNTGEFDITLNNVISFKSIHTREGNRKLNKYIDNFIPNTAFLGCSFTYGYGVNYEETFVSKVQDGMDSMRIKNYAVPGYGTVQSYLQLPEVLSMDGLSNVVVCISSVHVERNTLSRKFRSSLKIGFSNSNKHIEARMQGAKFPYMNDTTINPLFENWNNLYENYFLREYLASSNFLQNTMDRINDDHTEGVMITTALLQRMEKMCQEKGVRFFIVCLDDSPEMKEIEMVLTETPWLNVSFDFKREDLTLLPVDSHPNGKGHTVISEKIIRFLTDKLYGNK